MAYASAMGRPANLTRTVRKSVALSPEAWTAIDNFWHDQRLQSRSDAHQRLIEIGVEAAKKVEKKVEKK